MSPTSKESAPEEAVAPATAATAPVVAAPAKTKKKPLALGMGAIEWVCIVIGLAVLGGGVYDAHQALAGVSTEISVSATPTPIPVPSLPALSLNKTHQRQGAQIEVDPSLIGRPNPFAR